MFSAETLEQQAFIILADSEPIFADWLSIKSTCTMIHHVFMVKILPQFLQRLRGELRDRLPGILIDLINPHCVLTGGFLLGRILGTNWSDSDIDFCVDDLTENEYNKLTQIMHNIELYNINPHCVSRRFHVAHCNVGIISIDYVITSRELSVAQFISDFDFDFCKCWFDGTRLGILCPKSIITKKTVITAKDLLRSMSFAEDYIEFDDVDQRAKADDLLCILNKRINKYIDRGFIIVFDKATGKNRTMSEIINDLM